MAEVFERYGIEQAAHQNNDFRQRWNEPAARSGTAGP
jgi:hypothetical protein